MTDRCSGGGSIQGVFTGSEEPVKLNSGGIPLSEHEETFQPLSGSREEVLLDRFSTTLEDPRTGRRIR